MKISPKKPMSFDIDSRFSTEDLVEKSYGFYYPTPGISGLLVKMARIVESRGDCDQALTLAQAACERVEIENLDASHIVDSFEYFWGLNKKYGEEEFRFLDQVETLDYGVYIHALVQLPYSDDSRIRYQLACINQAVAHRDCNPATTRLLLCAKFWAHHIRGESTLAGEAFTAWEKRATESTKPESTVALAYEILMLNELGRFTQARNHSTGEDDVRIHIALIEAYAHTGMLDDAASWALMCLGGVVGGNLVGHYTAIARILPLLADEVRCYVQFAAYLLHQSGMVPQAQCEQLRSIFAAVSEFDVLPELSQAHQISEEAQLFVMALKIFSEPDPSVRLRRSLVRRLDDHRANHSYGGVGEFLWAHIMASLVRDTKGAQRRFWFSRVCDFSHHIPWLAVDLAQWCVDHAEPGDEVEALYSAAKTIVANKDLALVPEFYEACRRWAGQTKHLENDRVSTARGYFELGRLATIHKDWETARNELLTSITLHISGDWIRDLEDALCENPLIEDAEYDELDHVMLEAETSLDPADFERVYLLACDCQHEVYQMACLYHIVENRVMGTHLFQLIEPVRAWIDLCIHNDRRRPQDILFGHLIKNYQYYIWALCEHPATTVEDFRQAVEHFEAMLIAKSFLGIQLGDSSPDISWRLALSRTLIAYRFCDLNTAHEQRKIWCVPADKQWIGLREIETIYCIDEHVRTGNFEQGLAWVRESWGETELDTWLKAALLDLSVMAHEPDQAAQWFSELGDFSLAQHVASQCGKYQLYMAVAGEYGVLRYLARLVEQGESQLQPVLRDRVFSVLSVWNHVDLPRNMGCLSSALAVAVRVGFHHDELIPLTLSVVGNEWVDAQELFNPTASDAAKWFEEVAHAIGRLFESGHTPHGDSGAIYVSDLEAVREFFVEYFDAKTVGLYRNSATEVCTDYVVFEDTCNSIAYHCGLCIEIIQTPEGQRATNGVTIPLENSNNVDKIAQKLRRDGYEILIEPHETSDGKYESTVLGVEEIPITLSAGLR
ncbi:Glyoxalase-like domain [Corynebacterium mustelae]|uniref:Glyoxalase-like domain n=1 Tax=Corynebacterium mustelae TaxID=571915 RepID=A0A0G3H1J7_9CORY|nr:hypothetical protein [Corynebacterium mustelae]AKK05678.1 Glyoxalase-like domain [Corynebacterium mustelae]